MIDSALFFFAGYTLGVLSVFLFVKYFRDKIAALCEQIELILRQNEEREKLDKWNASMADRRKPQ